MVTGPGGGEASEPPDGGSWVTKAREAATAVNSKLLFAANNVHVPGCCTVVTSPDESYRWISFRGMARAVSRVIAVSKTSLRHDNQLTFSSLESRIVEVPSE